MESLSKKIADAWNALSNLFPGKRTANAWKALSNQIGGEFIEGQDYGWGPFEKPTCKVRARVKNGTRVRS